MTIRELSTDMQHKWVERLFARLLAIYGERFAAMWASTDKAEMKAVWANALGGFSSVELTSALDRCLGEKFAPNLPEFVSYCRDAMRLRGSQLPAIEAPQLSREEAAKRLAEFRAMWRGAA